MNLVTSLDSKMGQRESRSLCRSLCCLLTMVASFKGWLGERRVTQTFRGDFLLARSVLSEASSSKLIFGRFPSALRRFA